MKKVFEAYTFKDESGVRFANNGFLMRPAIFELKNGGNPQEYQRVRITVEDLPESKPELEKNCGNCVNKTNWPMISHTPCNECYMGSSWRPKPAEPQGWEQRFEKEFGFLGDDRHESCTVIQDLKSFIRAEIERVREEEKQLVFEWLRIYHSFDSAYAIKENKHREKP